MAAELESFFTVISPCPDQLRLTFWCSHEKIPFPTAVGNCCCLQGKRSMMILQTLPLLFQQADWKLPPLPWALQGYKNHGRQRLSPCCVRVGRKPWGARAGSFSSSLALQVQELNTSLTWSFIHRKAKYKSVFSSTGFNLNWNASHPVLVSGPPSS